jgi:hypothetical protein
MPSRETSIKTWNAILLGIASAAVAFGAFVFFLLGLYHRYQGNSPAGDWAFSMALNTFKWGGLTLFGLEAVLLMTSALIGCRHAWKRR